jgi:uncharacterized protein (TIGR03086 family)
VRYTKTVDLPVSPDEAFAHLTEPERLRRWQTVSAYVDLRAGGSYRWTVTPGNIAAGTFTEVVPGQRIVFGWGWVGNPDLPADASTVTVVVEPAGDGSRVTLSHEGLDEAQAAGHAEGWEHFLGRLEKLAATGDAGQDEWAWAPANLTPLVAAEAALAVVQPMLRNRTAEDRPKPTLCAEFSCHQVAEHLMSSLATFGEIAGVTVTRPDAGSLEHKVSTMADQAITAWQAVDLEGTVTGPGGAEVPAAYLVTVLPIEILLHGWDLAQGSGQTLHVSDELVAYVSKLAESTVPVGRSRGSYADEVEAAPDASPLDRLAAFAGRTAMAA